MQFRTNFFFLSPPNLGRGGEGGGKAAAAADTDRGKMSGWAHKDLSV